MEREKNTLFSRLAACRYEKIISVSCVIIFIVSLLPLLYMCRYVQASGDDYGYGALTHAAWLNTHSIVEVFKAAGQTVRHYFYGWQGTWFSIFLFALQPEVFSPYSYWIVPIIMLGLTIIGTSAPVYYLLVKKLYFTKSFFLLFDSCLLFMMLQFVPRTKSAMFWYNGTAHYIVPYFLAMIAVFSFFKYIDTYKLRYWLTALFCMSALGGASYLAALLAPIILCYLLIVYARKRRKVLFLFIPLLAEGIGLFISMAAPGNKIRGGEEMAFSISRALETVISSFIQGGQTLIDYIENKPVIFVIMLFMAAAVWDAMLLNEIEFKFPYPLIFIAAMFCVYCAMFAPGIYAGTEVSGGVPNTIYQVFLLTAAASMVYLLGWLKGVMARKYYAEAIKPFYLKPKYFRMTIAVPVMVVCIVLIIHFRSVVRGSTMFQCIEYVTSGQAEDYKEQMEERKILLLDDTSRVIKLPEINQEQGPLMHMEVLEDPNAWTNQVVCQFYDKDIVISVKRK